MWKLGNFPATQILCEINFGHFEAQKTWVAGKWLNFHTVTYPQSKFAIRLPRSVVKQKWHKYLQWRGDFDATPFYHLLYRRDAIITPQSWNDSLQCCSTFRKQTVTFFWWVNYLELWSRSKWSKTTKVQPKNWPTNVLLLFTILQAFQKKEFAL